MVRSVVRTIVTPRSGSTSRQTAQIAATVSPVLAQSIVLEGAEPNDPVAGTLASIGFDDDGGDGLHPLLTVVLDPGNYVALVGGFGTGTGAYTLDVVCYAPPPASICTTPNPIVEGAEPNDTVATATPIACCDEATGDVTVGGDDDWYALNLATRSRIIFATAAGPLGPISDTRIELFDAVGTTSLAFDDDGGPGIYSLIDITLDPGLYHINVDGFGSGTGCVGGSGAVSLAQRVNERPYVGSVFCVEIANLPSTSAWGILGFIDQLPPVDLGIIGMPGCLQYTDIAIVEVLTVTAGTAEWCLPIPVVPGLAGIEFNQQVVALDASANAFGAITSDFGEGVFGDRF